MNAGVRIRFEDLRNRWLQILSSEKHNAKQSVRRGLSLRSLSLELVQRYVVDPHRASRLDDEPEVDLVRVAGVEDESILAPPGGCVLDVRAIRRLRIRGQKQRLRLCLLDQRPERRGVRSPWSQPRDSLGERGPLVVGLLAAVVESDCGSAGVPIGRIQSPARIWAAGLGGCPGVGPAFEAPVADEVSQQPRFLLFDEEPRAGPDQDTRDEDGRQRDVQRVSSREPAPEMVYHRSGRHEQAVADDDQGRGSLDATGGVDGEGTEVADEEGERDARDTDQELRHVTLSVGSPKLISRI